MRNGLNILNKVLARNSNISISLIKLRNEGNSNKEFAKSLI